MAVLLRSALIGVSFKLFLFLSVFSGNLEEVFGFFVFFRTPAGSLAACETPEAVEERERDLERRLARAEEARGEEAAILEGRVCHVARDAL